VFQTVSSQGRLAGGLRPAALPPCGLARLATQLAAAGSRAGLLLALRSVSPERQLSPKELPWRPGCRWGKGQSSHSPHQTAGFPWCRAARCGDPSAGGVHETGIIPWLRRRASPAFCLLSLHGQWRRSEAQTTDPRVADLVRAGKLRVGLFLPQYIKGPDGLRTTVWIETARAYATRVGVPLAIVGACDPAGSHRVPEGRLLRPVVFCRSTHAPPRSETSRIFQFDYTLMVPGGSAITKVADADRPGVRIAAIRNHASTNEFVRQVKRAEFFFRRRHARGTFALIRQGKADVMASTRPSFCSTSRRS